MGSFRIGPLAGCGTVVARRAVGCGEVDPLSVVCWRGNHRLAWRGGPWRRMSNIAASSASNKTLRRWELVGLIFGMSGFM